MKIKLCKQNYDKINALLLAVNGKAEEHTITDANEILYDVLSAKHRLEQAGITGRNQQGANLMIVSSFNKMPNSYRYKRKVTMVTLYRGKEHWFVTNIQSLELFPNQHGGVTLTLADWQEKHVSVLAVKRLCKVV